MPARHAGARATEATRRTHVLHELLADTADLLAQRRGEEHNLLLARRLLEDLLDVPAHVWRAAVASGTGQSVAIVGAPLDIGSCDALSRRNVAAQRLATRPTQCFQHLVALVKNEMLNLVQLQVAFTNELLDTAGGADDAVRRLVLEHVLVLLSMDAHLAS